MKGVLQGNRTRPNSDRFGRVANGTRPNIPDTSDFQRFRTRQKRNKNAFVGHVFDASGPTRCERARVDALLARPTVRCPPDLPQQATTANALPAWTCLFTVRCHMAPLNRYPPYRSVLAIGKKMRYLRRIDQICFKSLTKSLPIGPGDWKG
eukprot:gene20511-biopygen13104